MFTVFMDSDKRLSKRSETTLYQGENLVDKLKFIIPQTYNGIDLSTFTVCLAYTDPANVVRRDTLALVDANYKESFMCYHVPVTSALTKFAGDIKVHLIIKNDQGQLMHSGDTVISIAPTDPCYQHIDVFPDSDDSGAGDGEGTEQGFPVVKF